jgi:diguanylate cyclase (GGDEF)-like protein
MRERSLIESAGRISSVVTERELLKAVNVSIPEIFGMDNFILFSFIDDRIEMLLGKPKNNNRKKYQEAISVFLKDIGNNNKFSVKNNYSIWDVGTTGGEKLIAVFEHNYQLDEKTQFLMNAFLPLILKAWEQISNIKILKKTAATDYLTGALNKMSFEKLADENLVKCRKKKLNACVVMFDIDFFTKVNNTYGHLIGDEVLKFVVQGLSDSLRNNDLLCRWGGEEFALLLTDISKDEAYAVVERIRESANKATLEGPVPVTLSAGLCFMPYNKIESLRSALNKADQSLYDAKNSGRNRLCSFDNLENSA